MKKYNNFLPSATARWCTIEMKLRPFEAWIADSLKKAQRLLLMLGSDMTRGAELDINLLIH